MGTTAIIRVLEVKRPISEEVLGYRLQAAHPNQAGRKRNGDQTTSFRGHYLIGQTSDFQAVGRKEVENFVRDLKLQGFDSFKLSE